MSPQEKLPLTSTLNNMHVKPMGMSPKGAIQGSILYIYIYIYRSMDIYIYIYIYIYIPGVQKKAERLIISIL